MVTLAACATTASVQDGQKLELDEGFLALHIDSNTVGNLWYVDYSPTSNFGSRFADAMTGGKGGVHVYKGQRYWLLNRPAGEYMWYEFNIGTSRASLRSSNRFRIKPGAITYVGHFDVTLTGTRLSVRARDDEADMRRYLEATYPAIYRTQPFEKELAELGLKAQ